MTFSIHNIFDENRSILDEISSNENDISKLLSICKLITQCFISGGKVFLCGNGGSAADAQHIAAELSGKFNMDRAPLYAEALHVNTSYLTATANDYGFEAVFERQVQAKASLGDVLIGISTSGTSKNVLNALKTAKAKGVLCVGLNGGKENEMNTHCDICINVPSENTPRIQEVHIVLGHIICEYVESEIFGKK